MVATKHEWNANTTLPATLDAPLPRLDKSDGTLSSSCEITEVIGDVERPRQYKLPYILRAPSEETEYAYLAEVPVLPGSRAWGATAEEALLNLEGIEVDFTQPASATTMSSLPPSSEPESS